MPIFVNERFSNTNHITAANHAQTNSGIIGGSFVFTNGRQLALTVSPVTGEVSVADGAFAFNGHLGGVILSESASYTPPPSDTSYTKNIVVIRYKRDTSTNIETYSLAVVSSEPQASEAAAEAVTITLAGDKIEDGTTTAEYPLWSFIATASSNTPPEQLFTLIPSMVELRDAIAGNAYGLQQEKAAREALENSVNKIQKGLVTLSTNVSGGIYENTGLKLSDFLAFIVVFSTGEPMIIPAVKGGAYNKRFYKFEGEGTLANPTKVTEGSRTIQVANFDHVKIMHGSSTNSSICGSLQKIYGIR